MISSIRGGNTTPRKWNLSPPVLLKTQITQQSSSCKNSAKEPINPSTDTSLLRQKMLVIHKHVMNMVAEHPTQTQVITEQLGCIIQAVRIKDCNALKSLKSSTIKSNTKSSGCQTQQYLPLFCQEISVIKQRPSNQQFLKRQFLRARDAINNDICQQNISLNRQNILLKQQNAYLQQNLSLLTTQLAEWKSKLQQLENMELKQTNTQQTVNVRVNECYMPHLKLQRSPSQELRLDGVNLVKSAFSPRSSNLSTRKSFLSSLKASVQSNAFDQISTGSGSAKFKRIPIFKQASCQTKQSQLEEQCHSPRYLQQQVEYYSKIISSLHQQISNKQKLIHKLQQKLALYLGKQRPTIRLTEQCMEDLLQQLYFKREGRHPILRKPTSAGTQQNVSISDRQLEVGSDRKLETIRQYSQPKRFLRRKG